MNKVCSKCGVEKSLDCFRHDENFVFQHRCIECEKEYSKFYRMDHGHAPMDKNKKCSLYLGVHVAERALEKEFEGITRMPNGNPGYDYICSKGYKIDVKSACGRCIRMKDEFLSWIFEISANQLADYFLCLAFGSRERLNPVHLWLIPGNVINLKKRIIIKGNELDKWSQYERPIDKVSAECVLIKAEDE